MKCSSCHKKQKYSAMIVAGMLLLLPGPTMAKSLAMVVDDSNDRVFVFDADTDTILASIHLASAVGTPRDCEITRDGTTGIVSSFTRLWLIDLTTTPPSLASGLNPVPITTDAETGLDSTISSDQRYAVLCGGASQTGDSLMASVDLVSRTVADTFDPPGNDCISVDTCLDGSLVITSSIAGTNGPQAKVRKLLIDSAGQLSDSGAVVDNTYDQNMTCAQTANTAVIIEANNVTSVDVPQLTAIDSGSTSTFNGSAAFHPTKDRLYLRSTTELRAIGVSQATGFINDTPLFTTPLQQHAPPYFGVDQIAVNPSGTKIYVSQPTAVNVYDADTGAFITAMTHPDLEEPLGVCILDSIIFVDGFESGDTSAWSTK